VSNSKTLKAISLQTRFSPGRLAGKPRVRKASRQLVLTAFAEIGPVIEELS
jgi:hypothetical protein